MQATITEVDDREFQASLRRLSALRGRPIQQIMRQSARRVAVNLAKGTPPVGDGINAYEKGARAVAADVGRVWKSTGQVMAELDEDQRKQFAWLQANKGPATQRKWLAEQGINLQPRRTATRAVHNRERRRGRVPRSAQPKYMVPGERISNLIARLVKRVLRAKNGWAMCARRLGGTRGLTSYITRSKGAPQPTGSVVEQPTQNGIQFTLINHVEHISRIVNRRTFATSIRNERNTLRREIERAVRARR